MSSHCFVSPIASILASPAALVIAPSHLKSRSFDLRSFALSISDFAISALDSSILPLEKSFTAFLKALALFREEFVASSTAPLNTFFASFIPRIFDSEPAFTEALIAAPAIKPKVLRKVLLIVLASRSLSYHGVAFCSSVI